MPFPKLSIALLLIISPLVLSDERLVQQECHLTQTPQVCLQCCTTNPHTKTADAVGIAITILGCIVDHATTLATSMSEMASKTTNKTMKITYQSCSVFFIDAKKDLKTIIDKVKIGDYGMAEYILTRIGQNYYEICEWLMEPSILQFEDLSYVPPGLKLEMKIFDELGVGVSRIIEGFDKRWFRRSIEI